MKNKLMPVVFILLCAISGYSQENIQPEYTGDNFSLEGALALFKKSNSVEEFERFINEEQQNVNNLDLNNDGQIDYIMVRDIQEKDTHVIVLSTYVNETEKQDIASIGIEKTGAEEAQLQIEGDSDLYAENTIFEPLDSVEKSAIKRGPNAFEIETTQVVVNVWVWPIVRFLYGPSYVVWISPYRWGNYPRWWKPWKPYRHTVFYGNCAPYRLHYHRTTVRRVTVARNVYTPHRKSSTLVVKTKRGTTVVRKTNRGTKVVKVKRTPARNRR